MKTYNLVKKVIKVEERLKLNEIKLSNLYSSIMSTNCSSTKNECIKMYDTIFKEQIELIRKHDIYMKVLKKVDKLLETL